MKRGERFDKEGAIKFYSETLCNSTELSKIYGISATTACKVMDTANDRMKFKIKMDKLEEEIFQYNPEREIQ